MTDDYQLGRDELMEALHADGIKSRTYFCPMNMQPFLESSPDFAPFRALSRRLSERGLYLPCGIALSDEDIAGVVERIQAIASARR